MDLKYFVYVSHFFLETSYIHIRWHPDPPPSTVFHWFENFNFFDFEAFNLLMHVIYILKSFNPIYGIIEKIKWNVHRVYQTINKQMYNSYVHKVSYNISEGII